MLVVEATEQMGVETAGQRFDIPASPATPPPPRQRGQVGRMGGGAAETRAESMEEWQHEVTTMLRDLTKRVERLQTDVTSLRSQR